MADVTVKLDPEFGSWLAGFAAGEGSFCILRNGQRSRHCTFRIALHHEDVGILAQIAELTGLGNVLVCEFPSQSSPQAMWTVSRKAECLALVGIFERFPLRAKKQRDFLIWARAVRAWDSHVYGDWVEMDMLRDELRAGRPQRGRKAWVV